MFNVVVSANGKDWEGENVMAMDSSRFAEYSGDEAADIRAGDAESLRRLNGTMAILMYEIGSDNDDIVRIGRIQNVILTGRDVSFRFLERGRVSREDLNVYSGRLRLEPFEHSRHHWAIKDGLIPSGLLEKASTTPERYDVALSFAGDDRVYVQKVAEVLAVAGLHVFYDENEEITSDLWGKDLTEHFHKVYRDQARFCVMFISKSYAEKAWTRLERRSALERAMRDENEYVLPARFDGSAIQGLRSSVGYVDLSKKTPEEFAKLVIKKVAHKSR